MKLKHKLLPIVAIAATAAAALPTIVSCDNGTGGGGGGGQDFKPITISYAFTIEPEKRMTPYESQYGEYVIPEGRLGEHPSLETLQKAYFELIGEHPEVLPDDLVYEFAQYMERLYSDPTILYPTLSESYLYTTLYGRFDVTLYDFDPETGLVTMSIFHKYHSVLVDYYELLPTYEYSYINYVTFTNVQLGLIGDTRTDFYVAYKGVYPDEIEGISRAKTLAYAQQDKQWQVEWTFVNMLQGADDRYIPHYMYWDFLNAGIQFLAPAEQPTAADCFATWALYGRNPYHLNNYWPEI